MSHLRLRAMRPLAPTPVQAPAAVILLACLCATASFAAVTPVHKCSENGVVTFQNMPCRPDEPVHVRRLRS